MFIITFSPFNIYDDVLCARVCACAYYEERSGGRFLPLSAAQFFLSSLFCMLFFFLFWRQNTQKTKNISLLKTPYINLLKDNTKKKRTTQDDDAREYYYFYYDDERDDD